MSSYWKNTDISNTVRTPMYVRLVGDDKLLEHSSGNNLRETKVLQDYRTMSHCPKRIHCRFFKDQVHASIYHALRRYRPCDEYVRTNIVHMPLDIWNELFDRHSPFMDNRKITDSTRKGMNYFQLQHLTGCVRHRLSSQRIGMTNAQPFPRYQ